MDLTFRGRAVELRVLQLEDMLEANDYSTDTGRTRDTGWFILQRSAHYVDDGSLVFADVLEIRTAPAPELMAIMALATEAGRVNGPPKTEGDGPLP